MTDFKKADQPYDPEKPIRLDKNQFKVFDVDVNRTGFFGASVTCKEPSRIWILFDEVLSPTGDVDISRVAPANLISFRLEPGSYKIETIEPYTGRYWKIVCLDGSVELSDIHLREFAHRTITEGKFHSSDERLNKIFKAGVETFRQNALDIYMDCPSRERAGWLCDSFFTARVEPDLTGGSQVERNFVENFLLAKPIKDLPRDMPFPMCFPADIYNGTFIPNWALWFVVQLEEYGLRTGDWDTVNAMRPKVEQLFKYFKKFENSDGLLEKLESWVFVEWSEANKFVQDVNYPSNMLYAGALSAAGRMYGEPDLVKKADQIRGTIRSQSFDGNFFVDNAVRKDGKLQPTRNRSEVCQYFAFFFNVADMKTNAALWETLQNDFGPDRKTTKKHPEIHMANSFVGNMLRMELLSRAGRNQQILDESIGYLLYMADRTGTLWEKTTPSASCCHGFASHACHMLFRDILGLKNIDRPGDIVTIHIGDLDLKSCEGEISTVDGPIKLSWRREGNKVYYRFKTPYGYEVALSAAPGIKLILDK